MSESRKLRAGKNIGYGLAAKLMLTILEFITRTLFIEYLGEEMLGINGVFKNIIQVLSLAELGMTNVVNFSFYKPLAEKNERKLSALIGFYKRVYNGIALSVLVIGLCLLPFLDVIITTELPVDNLHLIYLLFLAQTVCSYLFVYKASLMRADQKGYILTKYEIVTNVITVVAQMLAIRFLKSIYVYLGISVVYTFLMNLVWARRADREYPYLRNKPEKLVREEKQEITSTIKSGFIYKVSGILLNSTDNILISMIVGTVWVGYLANYDSLMASISVFYSILFSSMTASIGNLVASESEEKRYEIFRIMLCISGWMAMVVAVCFFALSTDFITIWLGSKYVLDPWTVLPKAVMIFLSCMLQPVFCYREATGLYRHIKYVMLLSAIINVGLSIVMGYVWGMAGILLASLVAMGSTYLWYEPMILYRDCFGIPVIRYYMVFIRNLLLVLVAMGTMYYVSSLMPASNLVAWVIKAVIIFCAVNVFCFCVYGRSDEFKAVKSLAMEGLSKWRKKA